MIYKMENDELFFLCVLAGAKDVVGIENPLEDKDDETVKKKWDEISIKLFEKKYLFKNEKDEFEMDEEISKVISVILFPDVVLTVAKEDPQGNDDLGYIYIRSYMCVHLENNGSCVINTYEQESKFLSFVTDYLGFVNYDDNTEKYMIVTTSAILDKAIRYAMKGKLKKGVKTISQQGISKNEMINMLDAISNSNNKIQIMAYRNVENETEAIFSIAKTEKGIWLLKLTSATDYEKASIYKSDSEEMINALIVF